MLKVNNMNLNAASRVNDTDVAFFGASFMGGDNPNFNISKNVMNMQVYEANKSVCDSDYAEFELFAKNASNRVFGTEDNEESVESGMGF